MDMRLLCLTTMASVMVLGAPAKAATILNLNPVVGTLAQVDLSSAVDKNVDPGGAYGGIAEAFIFAEGTSLMPTNSFTTGLGLAGLMTSPFLLHFDHVAGRGSVSGSFDLQMDGGESLFGWVTTRMGLNRTDTVSGADYATQDIQVRGLEAATDNFSVLDLGGGLFRVNYALVNTGDTVDEARLFVTSGAVPEPASWAMMIAGFGLVGGVMRHKRRGLAVRPA